MCLHILVLTSGQALKSSLLRKEVISSHESEPNSAAVMKSNGDIEVTRVNNLEIPMMLEEEVAEPRAMAPKILYGVMTTNEESHRAQVLAQVETWGAEPFQQGRYFATASSEFGQANSTNDVVRKILHRVSCPDDHSGVVCKEAHTLEVGFRHSPDWLVRVDDDNYVDTGLLESALSSLPGEDLKKPIVMAISLGCGKGLPIMKSAGCPKVAESGGICGGGGYALNMAALTLIQKLGWAHVLQEYESIRRSGIGYGDMVTTCVLNKIPGMEVRQLYGGAAANRVTTVKAWQYYVGQRPLTYHHMTPELTRWLHAKVQNTAQDKVRALEAKAFDRGCCCWTDEAMKEECQGGLSKIVPAMSGAYQPFQKPPTHQTKPHMPDLKTNGQFVNPI